MAASDVAWLREGGPTPDRSISIRELIGMLIGEFRPPDFDETNIIGSRVKAQTPKPLGLECEQRR